jgi:UDP-2,4-diacetamido-2,4,6-trideoxy-beta-L-altropyranose hydrolase
MQIVIRADASVQIGTGHIMRCLTLAQALQEKGALVNFICREHLGNLIEFIETKGFKVHRLPLHEQGVISEQSDEPLINIASTQQPCLKSTRPGQLVTNTLFHSHWLGSTQYQDTQDCMDVLKTLNPDWLIMDHYALDETWQVLLEDYYHKLMVIDDLADRKHQCNLLLDQTFGRKPEDYQALVPENCQMLLGSQYALLRPEFSQWREYSLKRREHPEFKKLLITMGGVDPENVTGQVLSALTKCNLPKELEVVVILGATAPHLEVVNEQVKILPYKAQVKVNVTNMAEIMANADLAIGAAGSTTWERCCLGLPSILLVLTENQRIIGKLINDAGAALCIDKGQLAHIDKQISQVQNQLESFILNAAKVADGTGLIQTMRYLK